MFLWCYQYTFWDRYYMTCNFIDLYYSDGTVILRNMAVMTMLKHFPFIFRTQGCTISKAATIHLNCNQTKVAKDAFHLVHRFTGGSCKDLLLLFQEVGP